MSHHDSFYRDFFSSPAIIRQLIVDFLPTEVADALDLNRLVRLDTSFVGSHGQLRESDLIWKIHFRNGQPLYLYLLLEFQSTPDAQMSLRLLEYITLLYRQLIREGQIRPEQLEEKNSAVAWLFGTDQAQDRDQLQRFYPRFLAALRQLPDYERTRRLVGRWILRSVRRKLGEDATIEQQLAEELDMLAENLPRILEQERQQGLQQGLQEGLKQGLQQGMEKGMRMMVVALHRSGMSVEAIASMSGQDEATVRRWLAETDQDSPSAQ